jgi:hypothetical protein
MMRRFFWFMLGVVAGITGMKWMRRKAGEIAEKLTPTAVFETLVDLVKLVVRKIFELVENQDPPVL